MSATRVAELASALRDARGRVQELEQALAEEVAALQNSCKHECVTAEDDGDCHSRRSIYTCDVCGYTMRTRGASSREGRA